MGGASGIEFVVSYACPYCGVVLEGKVGRADAWLRCPGCGRASRPPDHAVSPEPPQPRPETAGDPLVIRGEPEPVPVTQEGVAAATAYPLDPDAEPTSPVRVAFAAALFVSIVLLVFAFLEQSRTAAACFAVAAVVFLLLLAQPDGRRPGRRR